MGRGRGKTYAQSVLLTLELFKKQPSALICMYYIYIYSFWQVVLPKLMYS